MSKQNKVISIPTESLKDLNILSALFGTNSKVYIQGLIEIHLADMSEELNKVKQLTPKTL